ncbi:PAS domain-containing sensor histidine kinase [Archangium gephyra]|uniref:sensor histidine kinase n=1 Tax=Archangium gephyra TaxID=48 RepID=UPI0035D4D0AC
MTSDDRFRQFAEAIPDLVWTCRPDGTLDFVNARWQELVGTGMAAVEALEHLAHPEDLVRARDALRACLASGQPLELECRLRRERAGAHRRHRTRFTPVRDASGTVETWLCFGSDLEDERNLAALIHASMEELRLVTNSVPIHLLHLDTHERILFANQAAAKAWGRHPEEMVGRTIRELVGEEGQHALSPYTARVLRGERIAYEAPFLMPDGSTQYYLNTYVPELASDGTVLSFVATGMDITERKLAEESLRASHEREEASRRRLEDERELRERFVSTLTHDLRTPLSAAKMSAQLAQKRADNPEDVRRLTGRLIDNLDRADAMLRDLLDASLVHAGQRLAITRSECDLHALTLDVLQDLTTLYGDRFVLEAGEPLCSAWDCAGLRRLLENLCTNAVKYGATEQPITVTLRRVGLAARIDVHNQGPPIPPEVLPTLFQPFLRAPSGMTAAQQGWGLGLTLVKGIAEAHGGGIHIVSHAAHGTTFQVTLPLHPTA